MSRRQVKCPYCFHSGAVDETKIPAQGVKIKCPRCGERFSIARQKDGAPDVGVPQRSEDTTGSRMEKTAQPAPPSPSAPHSNDAGQEGDAKAPPKKRSIYSLSFHGTPSTLFGIYIMNILYTILTLGIYRFWGKIKVRQYLMSQSELMGERFAFHGTGKELCIGWLKAMVIIVVGYGIIMGLEYLNPIFILLVYPSALVVLAVAKVGSMRYRLSRTSWRGIRLSFRGSFRRGIKLYAGGLVLTIITLGLYYPIFHVKMRDFWTSNTYFGNRPLLYDGRGGDLMGAYLLALLLTIPTLGIYWFWFRARMQRYDWEHTTFPGIRFRYAATGANLLSLTAVNLLLLIFTLGLAIPWVIIRTLRFNFNYLSLRGAVDFDTIQQEAQGARAVGEGLADYLDLDVGWI
jgi:predicted Zn finger-like uncharacterized protein